MDRSTEVAGPSYSTMSYFNHHKFSAVNLLTTLMKDEVSAMPTKQQILEAWAVYHSNKLDLIYHTLKNLAEGHTVCVGVGASFLLRPPCSPFPQFSRSCSNKWASPSINQTEQLYSHKYLPATLPESQGKASYKAFLEPLSSRRTRRARISITSTKEWTSVGRSRDRIRHDPYPVPFNFTGFGFRSDFNRIVQNMIHILIRRITDFRIGALLRTYLN